MSSETAENGIERIAENDTLAADEVVEVNAGSNERNPDDDYDENLNAQDRENEENFNRKLCQFPLARVKKIMKSDPEIPSISQEALFLITKSMVRSFIILKLNYLQTSISGYQKLQFFDTHGKKLQ